MRLSTLAVLALLAAAAASHAGQRGAAEIVQAKCASCHETGKHGAPKVGDRDAWNARFRKGLDATVLAAIRGHGSMPARGGMAELTDAEFRAAVLHLYNPSGPPAKPARAPPLGPNQRLVDGTKVLLGVKPLGEGLYHVEVTLRDDRTDKPIDNAQVQARVTNPVMGADARTLVRSRTHGVASYGADFRVSGREPHVIEVDVRVPGRPRTIQASFELRH